MTVSRRLALSFLTGLLVLVALATTTRAGTVEPPPPPDPAPQCVAPAFPWGGWGKCWGPDDGKAFQRWLAEHGSSGTAFKKAYPELAAVFGPKWPTVDYDRRIARRLDRVLCRFGPMCNTGQAHVKAGREWRVNPFYIAAISAVESTFGIQACGFNAWGIGACAVAFASWVEGIRYTTRLIRRHYINEGLGNPFAIGREYCPPCGDGHGVKAVAVMTQYFGAKGVLWKDAVRAVK